MVPLVSVLMITYNHEEFIAQAIESVLSQKVDFNIELLIGEDSSQDGTKKIIEKYQQQYPDKIFPIYVSENVGPQLNFKQIYDQSRGKYIALLEGDDYWVDNKKLQMQVKFLEKNPNFAICHHKIKINRNNKLYKGTLRPAKVSSIENLAKKNYIYTASCVFRKNFPQIPDWFLKLPINDYPLHLLNASYGKIRYFNKVMSVYRVHSESYWSSKSAIYQRDKSSQTLEFLVLHFDEPVRSLLKTQYYNNIFDLIFDAKNVDIDIKNKYIDHIFKQHSKEEIIDMILNIRKQTMYDPNFLADHTFAKTILVALFKKLVKRIKKF